MSDITAAKQSPRIENGIIKWYAGDTFDIVLELDIKDQDDEDVTIASSSEVKIEFKNQRMETVKTFSFTDIDENTITLEFHDECTALFPKGEYRYRIYYTAGERTTLCADNLCVVE